MLTPEILLPGGLIGLMIYLVVQDVRSGRRLAAGKCVRCGMETSDPVDLTAEDVRPQVPLLMCESCAARTRRNHTLALRTFIVVGGIGILAMVIGVSRDLLNGIDYSARDAWLLASTLVIPVYAMYRVFRKGARRSRDNGVDDDVKDQ